MRPGNVLVLLLSLATAGCDLLSGPETGRRIVGVLEWSSDGSAAPAAAGAGPVGAAAALAEPLVAPDSANAGVAVPIRITTLGLSGCWRADGVALTGDYPVVGITPFDLILSRESEAELPCAGTLTAFPRTLHLAFPFPGTVTIRVQGRRVTGAGLPAGEDMIIEKTIVIR